MSSIASYRHRLNQAEPKKPDQEFVAFGLSQEPVHQHQWKRKPLDQQSMAAENRFIWTCYGCNAIKTLGFGEEP